MKRSRSSRSAHAAPPAPGDAVSTAGGGRAGALLVAISLDPRCQRDRSPASCKIKTSPHCSALPLGKICSYFARADQRGDIPPTVSTRRKPTPRFARQAQEVRREQGSEEFSHSFQLPLRLARAAVFKARKQIRSGAQRGFPRAYPARSSHSGRSRSGADSRRALRVRVPVGSGSLGLRCSTTEPGRRAGRPGVSGRRARIGPRAYPARDGGRTAPFPLRRRFVTAPEIRPKANPVRAGAGCEENKAS